MLSSKDLLIFVDKDFTITPEMKQNLSILLASVNNLLADYGQRVVVTSGLRTPARNMAVGGKPHSKHLTGQAVDISDYDGKLTDWCLAHPELLEKYGIWLEDRRWTPFWLHAQVVAPASGKRTFIP